jgi:hypothetical protein
MRGVQFDIDFFDPGADLFGLLTRKDEHFFGFRRDRGRLFNSRAIAHGGDWFARPAGLERRYSVR